MCLSDLGCDESSPCHQASTLSVCAGNATEGALSDARTKSADGLELKFGLPHKLLPHAAATRRMMNLLPHTYAPDENVYDDEELRAHP